MTAAVLLGLAWIAALIGASGFLVLGVTDLAKDADDEPPGTARALGVKALIVGMVGLLAAIALAFAAGRV